MAATRPAVLTLTDPSGSGGPQSTGRYPLPVLRTDENSPPYTVTATSYEDAEAGEPWSYDLFPFDAGMARSKAANPRGYFGTNGVDASFPDLLISGPSRTSYTLTSAVQQGTQVLQWQGLIWVLSGRYVHSINPSTHAVTTDRDLGAAVVGSFMCVVQDNLFICCGTTGFIQRRTSAGAWSTSADVRATAMAIVRDKVWKVQQAASGVDNELRSITALGTSAAANLMTLANWNNAGYAVNDNTHQCHSLFDYNGVVVAARPDGIFFPDPETRFARVTPSDIPYNTENFKGCWIADGYLFAPCIEGLFRIQPGEAIFVGPEVVGRTGLNLFVRGGTQWNGAMFVVANDLVSGGNQYIFKALPNPRGTSEAPYIWHMWKTLSLTGTNYGRYIGVSNLPTNPELFVGGGSAATNGGYYRLGLGSGRDIDDSNYLFASGTIDTGPFFPGGNRSMLSRLMGVEVTVTAGSSNTIALAYAVDDFTAAPSTSNMLTTQEGGGTQNITSTGTFIRYAATSAIGTAFRILATLNTNGTTTASRIWRMRAFGVRSPHATDEITVNVMSGKNVSLGPGLPGSGLSVAETERVFRSWMTRQTVLSMELEDYEADRTLRVIVTKVRVVPKGAQLGDGGSRVAQRVVQATLMRLDFANAYAS